jgi:hypothetical protein
MDIAKLRAWWAHKQELDASMKGSSSAQVLEKAGWARSVGGVNPYLTLFSRAGISREQADKDCANMAIYELPSARGCTYVLPKNDFVLGLAAGYSFGATTEIATAKKLGVPDEEVKKLCDKVLKALSDGPLDPRQIKEKLGDAIRNLGDEGKKRGLQTTLPLALGILQRDAKIRRVPLSGRLDSQRYSYAQWSPSPLDGFKKSQDDVFAELARKFWKWIGPASLANFQWFSALGVGATKKAVETLKLKPIEEGSELLILADEFEEFKSFKIPKDPQYSLISSIDGLVLLRRDLAAHVDDQDKKRQVFAEKGLRQVGHLLDLPNHGIVDRGKLIGLWEFDPFENRIVWTCWIKPDSELRATVAKTEAFVRDQLGDARSFSLDSPESRKPVLEALRKQS